MKTMILKGRISVLFIMIFLILSCSDKNDVKDTPILEISEQSVDFKSVGGSQSVVITTNTENWMAKVEQSAQEWCSAIPGLDGENKVLSINVSSNKGRDVRTAKITLTAEGLSKVITVRQLGTDKGILLSPMIKQMPAEGGKLEFKITANVEFEISSTVDWISKPVESRAGEYVTTDHLYMVSRNIAGSRSGSILVCEKNSDLAAEMVVNQDAFGDYEAGESNIKGDLIVPVESGAAVNNKGEESHYSISVFERAYDGDKSSGYYSGRPRDIYPNNWPLELTFNFNEQSRIDYCISYSSGQNLKKFDVYATTKSKEEYLVKNFDLTVGGISNMAKITFPEPIIDPIQIRMVVHESTTNVDLIIKEIEFYRKNPDTFDPTTLFTDVTCSELKQGITQKEIDACPDPFFRNIALYMFLDKYPREYRIQDYKPCYPPASFKKLRKTTGLQDILENVTGIYVKKGEEVIVLVGDTHGHEISTRIMNMNVPGGHGFSKNYSYSLSEGINRFISETDGVMYILYHVDKEDYYNEPPIRIHIPSGQVNGYFDSRKHKAEDWKRILDGAVAHHLDLIGEKAHLMYAVSDLKKYTPDGKALIDAYDQIVRLEQTLLGFYKYNLLEPINHVCFAVMYNGSIWASTYYTGYADHTMSQMCDVNKLTTGSIWGPGHEVGHMYQMYPRFRWRGMTEVTNNIMSLYVQTSFGNKARLYDPTSDGLYTSLYEESMYQYFCRKPQRPHVIADTDVNVFNQLPPFWQLFLYGKAKGGGEEFYKDMYQRLREYGDDVKTDPEWQLEFVYNSCDLLKTDLTQFFTKWGFLQPVNLDDAKGKFEITEDMVKATIERINNLDYPEPDVVVEYIHDDCVDCFKEKKTVLKGTGSRIGNSFKMAGWQNVVVFEVYSDGKLCFVTPASEFKIPETEILGNNVEVYAISATGDKTKVDL